MLALFQTISPPSTHFVYEGKITVFPLHFYEGSHLRASYVQSYQMCKYSLRLVPWPH